MCAYWAVDTQLWANKKKNNNNNNSAPWRANFREPRSTALYPNPRYNEARYNEGRLYTEHYKSSQTKLLQYNVKETREIFRGVFFQILCYQTEIEHINDNKVDSTGSVFW